MPYVLVAKQHAQQLSRSLMRLLRPSHLRTNEQTDLYCEVLTHPQTGEMAVALPDSETVPIHVQADGEELASLLATFVADAAITQQEASGIASAVSSMAGQRVRLADFIPPSWQANVRTAAQMKATGWFPADPFTA
jgi:hypothetical protein